jgi:hypothetical protein
MDILLSRIRLLPKDLQIIISEYDVEHRPKMKETLEEITYCVSYKYLCFICRTMKFGLYNFSNGLSDRKICSKRCCPKYKSSPYELVHFKGFQTTRLYYGVDYIQCSLIFND